MKVLIAFLFAVGSAAAVGSGPYLPSGWKPDGPAFFLPSEVQRPSEDPLKETLFQEAEASGSDALREYGPPKLDQSPLQVTNQGLPDVITEQKFFVEETKSAQDGDVESIVVEETSGVEVNAEQSLAALEVNPVTESQEAVSDDTTTVSGESTAQATLEVQPTIDANVLEVQSTIDGNVLEVQPNIDSSALGVQPTIDSSAPEVHPTIDGGVLADQPTFEGSIREVQPTFDTSVLEVQPTFEANAFEIQASLEGRALNIEVEKSTETVSETTEKVEEFVSAVEEVVDENVAVGVKNIADALETLEKEVKAIEVQTDEGVTEAKVTLETSGSLEQAPEGFLEYGPPGFREYGPPKEEDLLRSAIVQVSATDVLDNNEVRRRRFSPKFRSSKRAY